MKDFNPFFQLAVVLSTLFIVTILAITVMPLGDARALVAIFLSEHVGTILGCEVGGILVSGLLAMTVDRRQALQAFREARSKQDPSPDDN